MKALINLALAMRWLLVLAACLQVSSALRPPPQSRVCGRRAVLRIAAGMPMLGMAQAAVAAPERGMLGYVNPNKPPTSREQVTPREQTKDGEGKGYAEPSILRQTRR